MIQSVLHDMMRGDGVRARAMRGTALTLTGIGGSMVLRLASNLVLTRLLFPEAFGLMALVQVFLMGLQLLSDVGIHAAILQNARADEPRFLNTAWIMGMGRGVLLWLVTIAAAGPIAAFYDQPMLAQLLPVAGLSAVLNGAKSTLTAHANRNLLLGRLTALELGCQALGVLAMIALAFLTGSVWALLLGSLLGDVIKTALSHVVMPGERNRWTWDWGIFWEIFNFGKFIFFGSIAGFLVGNADRAILGKLATIGELGVYNIGYFLAFAPLMVTQRLADRILFPLYSMVHRRGGNSEERRKLSLARSGLIFFMMAIALFLGVAGDWLIRVLYTEPYYLAGPILVLLSLSFMPVIALSHYKVAFVGAGRPDLATSQIVTLAVVQILILYFGIRTYGLLGAVAAPGLSFLLIYPLIVWQARPMNLWSIRHDLLALLFLVCATALVLTIHADAVARLR